MKDFWTAHKKKIIALIAVVVIAAAGFGGYKYYQGKQEAKNQTQVQTATVKRVSLKSTVSATGTIMPVDSVEVSSKITARIKKVLVKENDTVKAGQTVAILDGKSLENKRDEAQFKVTNTRLEYERIRRLHDIGAKSEAELEDAEFAYNTAESALKETESDLAETVITAPMDGTVVGEPKTAGAMATQGSDNPTIIMRIADLSKKQIKAQIDETDIGNIKVGQMATFTVDAYTGKTFTARVSKISQTDITNSWDTQKSSTSSSSASVIYYYVTLDVDDPEGVLLPAMTARVDINTSENDNALAVPLAALKTNNNGSYVIVVHEDGTKENRSVEIGITGDEYVEILSGLEEGEQVSEEYVASAQAAATKKKNNSRRGGPPM